MMRKIIHKVNKDETLYTISKKYKIPFYIIAKENDIDEVSSGMRIIIPNPKGIKHIVKPYETLEIIAKRFNISAQMIKDNNYELKEVFLGQVIYIPYK